MAFGELFTFGPETELHVSEEEEAFEGGFVELGGVSSGNEIDGKAFRGGGGEDDGPG